MSDLFSVVKAQPAPPCTVVILGASGDLARRKLMPALYNLRACGHGMMDAKSQVLGFARRPIAPDKFRDSAHDAAKRFSAVEIKENCWAEFASVLHYLSGLDKPDGFKLLRARLEQLEAERGLPPNRIFYLSIPPGAILDAVDKLYEAGLISAPGAPNFTRLVVEKPIGHDLASALEISRAITRRFDESQIFRIDHYLGKETVQNLLVLRFANTLFEQLWNNRHVDHVQITVAESEGVGSRADYYDTAGALRDMVQNHMLQLLSLIAMEPPVTLDAGAIRDAKINVLSALRPLSAGDISSQVVRARYTAGTVGGEAAVAYAGEAGVELARGTETFVALKLFIDDWRWSGVPFYLRTGKRLAGRASEISVHFKHVPQVLFNRQGGLPADVLALRIQPDEGFSLQVMAKRPGLDLAMSQVKMNLHYASEFGGPSPEAYERLLLDVMAGDHTLFIAERQVEKSWQFLQPVLDAWRNDRTIPLAEYPAGGWGPKEADQLIGADGRTWREP
jgi:glucose-6-phosphate 1-dehydrogenase